MIDEYSEDLKEAKRMMEIASKYRPFTPEEEKLVVYVFYSCKRIINKYSDYLSPELLYYLVRVMKFAKDQIILRNLRLVIKGAKYFTGNGIPLVDLILEGTNGMIHALDNKFDPDRGFKLSTYFTCWIRQRCQRALENKSRLVKNPGHILALITKLKTIYRQHTVKYGEGPTPEEISEAFKVKYNLDISPERALELGRLQYTHTSLDDSTGDDNNISMMDFITYDGAATIEDEVEQNANREYIFKDLLSALNTEEKKLIVWKFGLLDYNTKRSSKEMASLMKMSLKDYNSMEAKTLDKLKSVADISKVNL